MSSQRFSIAIIGGGKAGIEMMNRLIDASFVDLVGIVDRNDDAPGLMIARDRGIPTKNDFIELFNENNDLDIIIDVTGIYSVREQLRAYMQQTNNNHTVIMHERISALLVSLFNGELVKMKESDGIY